MYQSLLNDGNFHRQLRAFDRDMADAARAGGCGKCGGALHSARYPRKPRGVPAGSGDEFSRRFSFCCAVDGCRARMTPSSLCFLGAKVWLATVVTLVTALQQGVTPGRAQRLSKELGIDRRTLGRWRRWWLETFAGPFRQQVTAAFLPPPALGGEPASLLERFAGGPAAQLIHLLRFLAPLTGRVPAVRAF